MTFKSKLLPLAGLTVALTSVPQTSKAGMRNNPHYDIAVRGLQNTKPSFSQIEKELGQIFQEAGEKKNPVDQFIDLSSYVLGRGGSNAQAKTILLKMLAAPEFTTGKTENEKFKIGYNLRAIAFSTAKETWLSLFEGAVKAMNSQQRKEMEGLLIKIQNSLKDQANKSDEKHKPFIVEELHKAKLKVTILAVVSGKSKLINKLSQKDWANPNSSIAGRLKDGYAAVENNKLVGKTVQP